MRDKIIYCLGSIFLLLSLCLGMICFIIHNHTIDFSALQQNVDAKPTILLDVQGRPWGQFQLDKRSYVALELMPDHLIKAFLVTEDRNFFNHPGISFRGIFRSAFINFIKGQRVQGASTITQQLVRLKFLSTQKTFSRKIKEQLYAILVEREWSKEQILEAYLNNVYFGYGIYGVQAAAQRFWGIDVSDISLDQAAVLASVMKSPRVYSPIHARKNVLKRRNLILNMMAQCGMVSLQNAKQAMRSDLVIKDLEVVQIAPHAKEMIRQLVEPIIGKEILYTGGLTIQTTLDIDIQKQAENAFNEHITILKKRLHEKVDGGLVTIDSKTGSIRAMIGGYDFKQSKWNRATQAHRQIGSVFKVLVYAAALEQGLKLSDVEIDEPIEVVQNDSVWRPENHNNIFLGPMTRAYALSHSNNIVTIKTLLKVGVQNVVDIARRCHISSFVPPYPSIALGCIDTTALEAVGAFNIIANHGCYVQPHLIVWIKNEHGQKIYKQTVVTKQAISSSIASQLTRVLMFSIDRLKERMPDYSLDCQAMGKSGTTNDCRTCWFCGATPELTTAIYVGCDFNQSLGKHIYGSKTGFPIWFKMHQNIAKTKTNFYYDPQLKNVLINWIDGKYNSDPHKPDVVSLLV